MVADGLTKDKGDPMALLRSVIKTGVYQIADEEGVLQRKAEEKTKRKSLGKQRQQQNSQKSEKNKNSSDTSTAEDEP